MFHYLPRLAVGPISFVLLISCFAAGLNAQVSRPPEKDGAKTSDAPIRFENRRATVHGVTTEVRNTVQLFNTTSKPVRAFSMLIVKGSESHVTMSTYNRGHAPELALQSYLVDDAKPQQMRVDWILYTDGSTWGPDEYGRSAEILGYFKGWHTAAEHAAEIVGYPASDAIMQKLNGPWGTSWSMLLPRDPADTRDEKDYFRKGYMSALHDVLEHPELKAVRHPKEVTDRLRQLLDEARQR